MQVAAILDEREVGTTLTPAPSALDGYTTSNFESSNGTNRKILRTGEGPAVIVIHEVPEITPLVAAFGRNVAERGMTAVLPNLFGTPGRPMTISNALTSFARACVSREFTIMATNRTSPIVAYLRELARDEHAKCGGPGVGTVNFKCVSR
jgi:dienelactone hydrolase